MAVTSELQLKSSGREQKSRLLQVAATWLQGHRIGLSIGPGVRRIALNGLTQEEWL
jgi:hypothetical protein